MASSVVGTYYADNASPQLSTGHLIQQQLLQTRSDSSHQRAPISSSSGNTTSGQMEKGYIVGNLDELESRFKCTYCERVLREPMQGDCGHRYCKNCVFLKNGEAKEHGEVPLCTACDPSERTEISPDRTYPDNAIKREITKSLMVLCPNRPCEQRMLVSGLADHLAVCEFKPQPCDLCGALVAAANLAAHREGDCPKRLTTCDVCKQSVQFDTLEEHKATTCVGTTVQCEYCLARIKDEDTAKAKHWASECPVGWYDGKPCPYGCAEMKENWREHRAKCLEIHVDRLLAKKVEAAKASPPASGKSTAAASDAPYKSDVAAPTAMPASEFAGPDYEELTGLIQRIRVLEKRSEEVALPAAVLAGEAGDQKLARKYVTDLQHALEQGDNLNRLLVEIKKQFDMSYDRIRQYELRLQKDIERKLDVERKHQELVKLLAYKEMKILDLERRIEILEHAGYDGVLIWKITDVRRRKEEAREGKVCSIYSPPFYTGKSGYKMCGRLYLNGDGAGKNTHISLFFVIMRGAFDALLPWPFSKKVSMMLLDQNFEEHVIDAFKPDTSSSSFKRPTTDMNIASGCPLFMPLMDFENSTRGYVKDDTMFIKFIVDKSDLPT